MNIIYVHTYMLTKKDGGLLSTYVQKQPRQYKEALAFLGYIQRKRSFMQLILSKLAFYICTKIASAIQRGLGLFGVHSKKEKLYVVNSFQAFLEWILKNEAWPRISFYGSYCFNGHKRKAFLKPQRPKAYQFISNRLSGKTLNKEYAILNLSQHTQ